MRQHHMLPAVPPKHVQVRKLTRKDTKNKSLGLDLQLKESDGVPSHLLTLGGSLLQTSTTARVSSPRRWCKVATSSASVAFQRHGEFLKSVKDDMASAVPVPIVKSCMSRSGPPI